MKKAIAKLSLCIFLLLAIAGISVNLNAQEVKVDIQIEKNTRVATVKIESNKEMKVVKLYKKSSNGKYILFFVSKPNSKTYEYKMMRTLLSTLTETEIKVVVIDDEETAVVDKTIEKLPEDVPINPEETAEPSWSPSPIPTKPTTSPSGSEQPTPSQSPSNEEISTAFDLYSFSKVKATKAINAKSKEGKTLSYTSKDTKVAKVDENGKVTAVGPGKTQIIIKEQGGKSKEVTVIVPEIRSREDALEPWYKAMKDQRDATLNSKYDWVGNQQTIEGSKKQGTCITFPSVSLQRAGILSSGEYLTAQNGTNFSASLIARAVATVAKHKNSIELIDLRPGKSANELGDSLLKGDIVNYSTHTQVYMGKNSKGKRIYNTAGQRAKTGYNRALLNVEGGSYDNKGIGMIFRIKTYNIYASCKNGTVSGNDQYMAMQDAKIKYKPIEGKTLKSVKVDGEKIDITKYPTEYTFKKIQEKHTIEIVYE